MTLSTGAPVARALDALRTALRTYRATGQRASPDVDSFSPEGQAMRKAGRALCAALDAEPMP